jgi:hypothetical protein
MFCTLTVHLNDCCDYIRVSMELIFVMFARKRGCQQSVQNAIMSSMKIL